MRDFGYSKRGRDVNEAQAEVHAAFAEVVNKNDKNDSKTRRWLSAIDAFREACARVYPQPLRAVDEGAKRASDIDTSDMLDFLEADPVFDRSGYMKEKLLTELKRRKLDRREVERLQAIRCPLPTHDCRKLPFCFRPIADLSFAASLSGWESKTLGFWS